MRSPPSGASVPAPHGARTLPARAGLSRPRTLARVAELALLAVLAAAGLWISYHHFRWQWHLEGDITAPYAFWQSVLHDGAGAITRWRYAQDNWLFSLLIPDMGLYWLAGPSPWLAMLQGWVIFVLLCLLFAVLVAPVVGRQIAAWSGALLLFAGPGAIGGGAFLTYPASHNVSLLWGLGGLVCFTRWIVRQRAAWLLAGAACLFVGEMSDPWLGPALALPVVLAATATAVLRRERRGAALCAALAAACVMVLVRTRAFGALKFLPGNDLVLGTWGELREHLRWVPIYLSILFNAIPVPQPTYDWIAPPAIRALDCGIVAGWLGWAVLRLWAARARMSVAAVFLAGCALLGCLGTVAALLVAHVSLIFVTGRYLSNWYVLFPLLLVIAAFAIGKPPPRRAAFAMALWCVLFIAAGLAASPSSLMVLPPSLATPDELALLRFLNDHQLTYGYAPYWSTNASALQLLSGNRIIVRPVMASESGRIVPRIAQTLPSWFEASDVPPGQRRFFLIASPDAELCPDTAACQAMAERDFGPPEQVLHFGTVPVLVWDYPILTGSPPRAVIAAAPVLAPDVPLSFARNGAGVPLLWRGWGGPEVEGSWSEMHQAVVLVHLPDSWTGDAVLDLQAYGFTGRGIRRQRVTASVDGRTLATFAAAFPPATFQVRIPAAIASRKLIPLVLDLPDAGRNSDMYYVYDLRLLGLYLMHLTLRHP